MSIASIFKALTSQPTAQELIAMCESDIAQLEQAHKGIGERIAEARARLERLKRGTK